MNTNKSCLLVHFHLLSVIQSNLSHAGFTWISNKCAWNGSFSVPLCFGSKVIFFFFWSTPYGHKRNEYIINYNCRLRDIQIQEGIEDGAVFENRPG